MSHHFHAASSPESTDILAQSPNECEEAGNLGPCLQFLMQRAANLTIAELSQMMLRRSLVTTRMVMGRLLPYYFMYLLAIRYIKEQTALESSQECISTKPVYPWWEEQQCVLDSESTITDLDHSIKEQLQADGWILDRSGQEASLSPFPPDIDSVILAHSYITTLENWLLSNVEDPEEIIPVDGDIEPYVFVISDIRRGIQDPAFVNARTKLTARYEYHQV